MVVIVPTSIPSVSLILIVDKPNPIWLSLVVVVALTVVIVDKISPVAPTAAVVLTELNPKASATVPVRVPPSMCNLPAESILEVPPRL